jgi:hypothetical protein
MYILMRYAAGITVEALILAQGSNRMRVVVAGLPDAIELKRSGEGWLAPDRQAVELDFVMFPDAGNPGVSVPQNGHTTHTAAR